MEEEVVYPNPFVGEELEIMCHRAVLNLRKTRLEQEIKEYSALFKFATPEMESSMWWPQTALQDSSAWLHQAIDYTDALWRLQDPLRPLHGCLGRHRPCGFLAPPPPSPGLTFSSFRAN